MNEVITQNNESIEKKPVYPATFDNLNISPRILDILGLSKYINPTPIQIKTIPVALTGKDLMGIAQTGTGKTLAYAVPIIQQILSLNDKRQALIVVPTRELAMQVDETFEKMSRAFGFRRSIIIGGMPYGKQANMLRAKPQIIIGTPGRLIDHAQKRTLNLSNIGYLVLDEADRMFDMGFMPQIKQILSFLNKDRQTMLFSATMPEEIKRIATSYMKDPVKIEVARSGQVAERINQELFLLQKDRKIFLLEKLLQKYKGTVLVFSRTKHGARKICTSIKTMGVTAAEIHSNKSLQQRMAALAGFKSGKHRVLVATDIAARGIDVNNIELIINFDIPENPEDYIHRIGRTGRAGKAGHAISFATPDQKHKIFTIERLTRTKIKTSRF